MTKKNERILIIDDEEAIRDGCRQVLSRKGYPVETTGDALQGLAMALRNLYDIVLLDIRMPGMEGFEILKRLKSERSISAKVIIITGYGSVPLAVEAMRQGASDFLTKPYSASELLAAVEKALEKREAHRPGKEIPVLVGSSDYMNELKESVMRIASTDSTVLITGESGTGKELIARTVHNLGRRAESSFVPVDCSSLVETLMESELFGHVKGSFTDARSDRIGRIELASGGTLFLDEVGNLPLGLQSKLLRVLETRQIIRLGSNTSINVDIRLICATNMPIAELVNRKQFRQDLLYRINTVEIHLPPLRERYDDLKPLTEHFTGQVCRKYQKTPKTISEAALKKLTTYHWPGNVRELKHALERAVILSDAPVLQPGDFLFSQISENAEELTFKDLNLEQAEETLVRRALSKYQGNISQAAKELGLTRAALYRRLEKYGL